MQSAIETLPTYVEHDNGLNVGSLRQQKKQTREEGRMSEIKCARSRARRNACSNSDGIEAKRSASERRDLSDFSTCEAFLEMQNGIHNRIVYSKSSDEVYLEIPYDSYY